MGIAHRCGHAVAVLAAMFGRGKETEQRKFGRSDLARLDEDFFWYSIKIDMNHIV